MFGPNAVPVRGEANGARAYEDQGLIQRSTKQLFAYIRECQQDVEFILRCSLLEVYREQLRDLLSPSNLGLKIKESPSRGIFVEGLTQEFVVCEEDVYQLIALAEKMRAVATTRLNQQSSRSHVIFMLSCTQKLPDGTEKVGKLNLVDLAGSEKVWKSGSQGDTLEEAKKINWSLSALGNVINSLKEKRPHIPYRDSKLTRILQETLGGNYKTTLVVTCTRSSLHTEETLSSLHFATRARSVCNHVKVNLLYSQEQLMSLLEKLQRELRMSRRKVQRLQAVRGSVIEEEEEEEEAAGEVLMEEVPAAATRGSNDGAAAMAQLTDWAEKVQSLESEKEAMVKELEQWKRVAQESQETIQGLEAALGMQEQVLDETRADRDRLLREALQRTAPPGEAAPNSKDDAAYSAQSIGNSVQVPLWELVHA